MTDPVESFPEGLEEMWDDPEVRQRARCHGKSVVLAAIADEWEAERAREPAGTKKCFREHPELRAKRFFDGTEDEDCPLAMGPSARRYSIEGPSGGPFYMADEADFVAGARIYALGQF